MDTLYSILVAVDVLLAIGIIGLVLIQHGKGADVGAAFGSGASGTVFGSRGSASFLTRATAILVTLFFINSLALAYLASHRPLVESVIDSNSEVMVDTPNIDAASEEDKIIRSLDDQPSETIDTITESDFPTEVDSTLNEEQDTVVTPDDVPE